MLPEVERVRSGAEFDELFEAYARYVEFASPAAAVAYENRDAFLLFLVRRVAAEHFGPEPDRQPYILEAWWPDQTRYLDVARWQCTPEFLESLHALLSDEFVDYRIQVAVFDDPRDADTFLGSLVLYHDRLVIEATLDEQLQLSRPVRV
jgi:hypothetical protein